MTKAVLTRKREPNYDRPEARHHVPATYRRQVEAVTGDLIVSYEPRRSTYDAGRRGGRHAYFAAEVPRPHSDFLACHRQKYLPLLTALPGTGFDRTRPLPHLATMTESYVGLTQLGQPSRIPGSPEEAVLERVPNPTPDRAYLVRFTCPEFTSLCPLTGQPDFAHIVLDYIPGAWIVESKSLKLYLTSFRNHGAFHEACTMAIAERLVSALSPAWLRIGAYWYPRGGMPIDVFWQSGVPPEDVWIPEHGVPSYRGRG